jgi:hypothetical protein
MDRGFARALLHAGRCQVVKERRSDKELRQMMLAAARKHQECSELEDLFIFGPTARPGANWGFGIAGKENKFSVACYIRLDQIASHLQEKYELHPVKAARRDIEARVWSLVHDHPTLEPWLSRSGSPRSRNWKVARIGQWSGVLTIRWPKLPLNGSSGLFKRKLSWSKRSLTKLRVPSCQYQRKNRAALETKTAFSNFLVATAEVDSGCLGARD